MTMVDLRSDTVTKPTHDMRLAMFQAEVGDDGYGEDPTVRALEEMAAQITGKEDGLFVTSGTMGNQIAAMVYTRKCDEIICDAAAHMLDSETGGIAALAGAQPHPLAGVQGKLSPQEIEDAIWTKKMNAPHTALIAVENTHNHAGGTFYTPTELEAIRNVANKCFIPLYMDGARIFNAAVAQNLTVEALAKYSDSMQFCLSKGLCAPVGSVLVGTRDFIQQARRYRRLLGGGMRKSGVIAAAGIVALKTMVDRLAEDHFHARMLGEAIANTKLKIDLTTVQTNIVMFDVSPMGVNAAQFIQELRTYNIGASEISKYKVRMVTHHDVTRNDIKYTIGILTKLVGK